MKNCPTTNRILSSVTLAVLVALSAGCDASADDDARPAPPAEASESSGTNHAGLSKPATPAEPAVRANRAARAEPAQFHRGVCYAHSWRGRGGGGGGGYGTAISAESIAELAAIGVNWISLTPFAYQSSLGDTSQGTIHDRPGHETDAAMARDIAAARDAGIQVMLKPHVWIRHGEWPGDIDFDRDEDWAAWFDSYTRVAVHYGRFAQDSGAAAYCIGNELKTAAISQPERWRKLIAEVREVYDGPLIYAANWDEYDRITWWDALDYVGVNAYFPLAEEPDPTLDQLMAGAREVRSKIEVFQRRVDRPIIFTEIGYRSVAGAAERPWEHDRASHQYDGELQARCYEAIYLTFAEAPWLRGIYWWKWFSSGSASTPGRMARDPFSPRGKPAERIVQTWYQSMAAAQ